MPGAELAYLAADFQVKQTSIGVFVAIATSLCLSDPSRWALIFGQPIGSGQGAIGLNNSAVSTQYNALPTSLFPVAFNFRDVGIWVQQQIFGLGTGGATTIVVTEILYRPSGRLPTEEEYRHMAANMRGQY